MLLRDAEIQEERYDNAVVFEDRCQRINWDFKAFLLHS